jgi:hypothetical protein
MFIWTWGIALSGATAQDKIEKGIVKFSFFHFLFRLEIRATYKSLDLTVT